MPPKKQPVVWEAPRHTIAKIKLLREYLHRWFSILGRKCHGQDLLYVDGFSGPGEYTNHPAGSPIAAMEAARQARRDAATDWVAGKMRFSFIDEDVGRIEHLQGKVADHQASRDFPDMSLPRLDGRGGSHVTRPGAGLRRPRDSDTPASSADADDYKTPRCTRTMPASPRPVWATARPAPS